MKIATALNEGECEREREDGEKIVCLGMSRSEQRNKILSQGSSFGEEGEADSNRTV